MTAKRAGAGIGLDPFILIMLGLVLLATFAPVRGEAAVIAGRVTDAAIFLLFFLHGAKLSRAAIVAGAANWRVHLLVLAMTFVLFPLIGLALKAALPAMIAPALLGGFLFLCLLPSTVQSSIAFTAIAGGDLAAAVCSASLSNLLGIVLTPLLVATLMGQNAGISWNAIEKIALQLLLPFILGHLARPWISKFIEQHKTLVARVDRSSILLVVYTAFSASVVEGLWSEVGITDVIKVALLSALVLAMVLWVCWNLAAAFGFRREERIVILFCGSKKSLVSGVPMASTLFPPSLLGPMLLPLMIFHQLQLIVCAFLAQKLRPQSPAA